MMAVQLSEYDNSWFKPGRSIFAQLAWFFFGSPLVRNHWIPMSSLRVTVLKLFGARIDRDVVVKPGLRVKFPWKLRVGANSWIGEDVWIDNLTDVEIGSNCCVSQGAYFCTGNHDWSDPSFGLIVRGIRMRDGAWAGARSLLAPGVTLGECAVAAAGSVVLRDIPPSEIHGGNPASFMKKRVIRSTSSASQTMSSKNDYSRDFVPAREEAGAAR